MTYILSKNNFYQILGKKNIVYKEAPDYVIDYLRIVQKAHVWQSNTRPEGAILVKGTSLNWPCEEELRLPEKEEHESVDVIHYIRNEQPKNFKYRRHYLNEFLKKNFSVLTVYKGEAVNCRAKYCIISDARDSQYVLNNAEKFDIPVYYDRTDYWDGLDDEVESRTMEMAKVITCSSQWLYDNSSEDKRKLILNGANRYKYDPRTTKKDIIVYVGNNAKKVNVDYCNKIREQYPDYKFVSIGVTIDGFEYKAQMPWKKMMDYLSTCKIGLIPLKTDAYFKGQLNLKYWDYKQAHLEVITNDDYNFKTAVMRYWDFVCQEIVSAYDLKIPKLIVRRSKPDAEYRIWWSISNKCNFHCPYCCQRAMQSEYEIKVDEVYKVAAKLNELFRKCNKDCRISILGGEPAIFDLHKILEIITKNYGKRLKVVLLTNFSLHDAEWWDSLSLYADIALLASCHVSQVKDINTWIDKAKQLKNIKFKAKFVVEDNNFEEVKHYYEMMTKEGLKVTLEGCRDAEHHPLFSNEVYEYIKEHDLPAYNMGGKEITQTEAIINFHNEATNWVKCNRRLSIRGSTVITGCKYKDVEYPIFELDELKDQISICDKAKICNLCKVNEVYAYEK